MIKKIEIEPIPLTEGCSKLVLKVENGIIVEGYYYALVPVRGFETLLLDKEAPFATVAATRICGMCQAVHSIAAAKAIENACNIEIPEAAEKLREVLNLAVRVYNHLLHHIVISGNMFENKNERFEFIKGVQRIRKNISTIMEIIGGEIVHPPNVVVGGISSSIDESVRERLINLANESIPLAEKETKRFTDYINHIWEKRNLPDNLGSHNLDFFVAEDFRTEEIEELYPQEAFPEFPLKREATNTLVKIKGRAVETGVRARKVKKEGLKPAGGIKELHILRAKEIIDALKKMKTILEHNTFNRELWNREFPVSDGEIIGTGLVEAPRGVNIHQVRVDKSGKITYYKIIVPTAINMLAISEALKGEKVEYAEMVVRAYDPCIACATH
ncbi:nickel-dependent hydrogenase large subunit [Desulfurobacterium sp.]